ncbi:MAG: glcA 1 [Sphingobacteriaceae bacterium]|jgi:beta-glucanase (GH16 family)|nr:glcA 1 [Sphingobacteriaceae bacterium]
MKSNLFKTLILLACVPLLLASCSKKEKGSPAIVEPPAPVQPLPPTPAHITSGFDLAWSDEFDGTSLNMAKWMYRGDGTVRNLATVSKNTISLDGSGNLVMRVTKDANGVYNVGQVATDGLFTQRYGYFECRAKMNISIGPHVAFWLQSNTMGIETNDPANNGTEIDIFEYHRKAPTTVFHNLHWNGYGAGHQTVGTKYQFSGVGTGYHVFGLEWNENEYVFYVDGKESWRTSDAISKIPQYMILSTELTGWGGDPANGLFPDQVVFDYVRVYKKK